MTDPASKRVTRGFGTWNDASQLCRPIGLSCIGKHVYICDSENHVLKRFSAAHLDELELVAGLGRSVWGKFEGNPLTTPLPSPSAVFAGHSGEIFISSAWSALLYQLEGSKLTVKLGITEGNSTESKVSKIALESPTGGCYYKETESILLVDYDGDVIRQIFKGGEVKTIGKGNSQRLDGNFLKCNFQQPYAICRAQYKTEDHVFYVTERASIRTLRFPQKIVTTFAGTGEVGFCDGPRDTAQFNELKEIVAARDKTIFVADYGNERIRKITPSGQVTTLVGPLSSSSILENVISDMNKPGPVGICLTGHGDLIFSQPKLNLIKVVHSAIDPKQVDVPSFDYPAHTHPVLSLSQVRNFADKCEVASSELLLPLSFLNFIHPTLMPNLSTFLQLVADRNLPMEGVMDVLSSETFPSDWPPTSRLDFLYICKKCSLSLVFRNTLIIDVEAQLNAVGHDDLYSLLNHVEQNCKSYKELGNLIASAIIGQMSRLDLKELPSNLSAFARRRFDNYSLQLLSEGSVLPLRQYIVVDTHIRSSMERLYDATVSSQRLTAEKSLKKENELISLVSPCNFSIVSIDGYNIPCHDWVLYARWPYFRHLVASGASEWNQTKQIEIPAETFSRSTLRTFVKYLYTNRVFAVVSNNSIAFEMLLHAQRFHLANFETPPVAHPAFAPLLTACETIFHDVCSLDNCVDRYLIAMEYGSESTQKRIATFIVEHMDELLRADSASREKVISLGPEILANIWIWVSGGPRNAFSKGEA